MKRLIKNNKRLYNLESKEIIKKQPTILKTFLKFTTGWMLMTGFTIYSGLYLINEESRNHYIKKIIKSLKSELYFLTL
jgi:type II secretory pathway component PulF